MFSICWKAQVFGQLSSNTAVQSCPMVFYSAAALQSVSFPPL